MGRQSGVIITKPLRGLFGHPALRKQVLIQSNTPRKGFSICVKPMNQQLNVNRAPHDKQNPYTQVSNRLIKDDRVSPEALGVMTWILSNADDFVIRLKTIMKRFGIGRDKASGILKELETLQYIEREKHGQQGRFEWHIVAYEIPKSELQPSTENPLMVPSTENHHQLKTRTLITNNESELKTKKVVEEEEHTQPGNYLQNPSDSFEDLVKFPKPKPKPVDDMTPKLTKLEQAIADVCLIMPDLMLPFQYDAIQTTARKLKAVGVKDDVIPVFREFWQETKPTQAFNLRPAYLLEHWGAFSQWLSMTGE